MWCGECGYEGELWRITVSRRYPARDDIDDFYYVCRSCRDAFLIKIAEEFPEWEYEVSLTSPEDIAQEGRNAIRYQRRMIAQREWGANLLKEAKKCKDREDYPANLFTDGELE